MLRNTASLLRQDVPVVSGNMVVMEMVVVEEPRVGSLHGEEPRVGSLDGEEPRVGSLDDEEPRIGSYI